MQTELVEKIKQVAILEFLTSLQDKVHSVKELIEAIRAENRRAEAYGQKNIDDLLEVSNYQWHLEQAEMKLKAPSLIKIAFTADKNTAAVSETQEEKVEKLLLQMIISFIGDRHAETIIPDQNSAKHHHRLFS